MEWNKIDFSQLPSPCYVIDCDVLKNRLKTLKQHCDHVGIKPLLAVKGFPLAILFEDMAPYLYGISASGLFESRLGARMGKEVHIHAPAYKSEEIGAVLEQCSHIVFNSLGQWTQFRGLVDSGKRHPSIGLRINPEYSEVEVAKYNPCLPYSRFGATREVLDHQELSGIEGVHIHVMCDQGAETFARVIEHTVDKFRNILPQLSWINFGGGQRLADPDYQIEILQEPLGRLISKYGLEVYVEPCESLTAECGYLVSTVLDIVKNVKKTAILDTSALCHMPGILEMPYRPNIVFPSDGNTGDYSYIFAGVSCMAGDIIGEYKLTTPLQVGTRVVFVEMGAYTFVRENYFNGINHPAIAFYDRKQGFRIVKQFDYQDYAHKYLGE